MKSISKLSVLKTGIWNIYFSNTLVNQKVEKDRCSHFYETGKQEHNKHFYSQSHVLDLLYGNYSNLTIHKTMQQIKTSKNQNFSRIQIFSLVWDNSKWLVCTLFHQTHIQTKSLKRGRKDTLAYSNTSQKCTHTPHVLTLTTVVKHFKCVIFYIQFIAIYVCV